MRLLLICATVLWNLSSSVLECSSNGVFHTMAGGNGDLKTLLDGGSRLVFDLFGPAGAVFERGVDHIDKVIHQQSQNTCAERTKEYLSQFFYTREEMDKILNQAFDASKSQIIQTHLNNMRDAMTDLLKAENTKNPWKDRIQNYCKYARTMSRESLNIITIAADSNNGLNGNLDMKFSWVVKALDGILQAFDASQEVWKALKELPDQTGHGMSMSELKLMTENAIYDIQSVIISMIGFDQRFWDEILPSTQQFENGQNAIRPTGIRAVSAYEIQKWEKSEWYGYGHCKHGYDAWLECTYQTDVHSESKGPIGGIDQYQWFVRSDDSWGCDSESTYVGNMPSSGYTSEVEKLKASTECTSSKHILFDDAKWFYETDDFFRLENAFMNVYWRSDEWSFVKYSKHDFSYWWHNDFAGTLRLLENQKGMMITSILYNGLIKAGSRHGLLYGLQQKGVSTWGEGAEDLSMDEAYDVRYNIRRRSLAELEDIVRTKTTEELEAMVKEDKNLLGQLLDMERHVESQGSKKNPGTLEDLKNRRAQMEKERQQKAKSDSGNLDSVSSQSLIEEAVAEVMAPKNLSDSTWNVTQMGVAFFIGASLVYLYKSYTTKNNLAVTYGLLSEEV